MNKKLFLDIHVIQTLPPSNINRDDTGSPKTAQYGGVRRARVSSQAWKKAIRDYFRDNSAEGKVGVRTLEVVHYVAEQIIALDANISLENALTMADTALNDAGVKTKDFKAKALFFIGHQQAKELAKAAIAKESNKDVLKAILKANPDIDIALFGRMVADDPSLNEDASCQVAHAISTHAIQNEFDFYTAIDDCSAEDQAGAGMLGTIEFNSSTLYRYANVAVHELVQQLGDKAVAEKVLKLFVKAFVNSLPTGKVNTFANQTIPQLLLVSLRTDRPINLVSAFEQPVTSREGYVDKSIEKLADEYKKTKKFTETPVSSMYICLNDDKEYANLGEMKTSLNALLEDFSKEYSRIMN